MKVKSIEKKEYELVTLTGPRFYKRWSAEFWTTFNDTCVNNADELEAAYQRFKNPPYTIEVKNSGSLSYFVVQIKDITLFSYNFTRLEIYDKKQKLEQALDSLMEK